MMQTRRTGLGSYAGSRTFDLRCANAAVRAICAVAPLLLTSCGAEVYEQRLENTKKLFAHMEMLDGQLHRDWVDSDAGVKLRLPLQFSTLLASTEAGSLGGAKRAEGEPPLSDDRQPKYMNIELPGLRGAFVARLKTIGANGAITEVEGYAYVLTNHHLANTGDRLKGFHRDVATLLSQSLHVGVKPEDERQEGFPRSGSAAFVPVVAYRSLTLNPVEPVFGVERQFSLYMHEQGDIQTVILFVLPKDVDGVERLNDRIPLCLETLRVTGDKPTVPSQSGGSTPAKGKGPGF